MAGRRPLVDLNPVWLATSSARQGMGIAFDCTHPPHGPGCRVVACFYVPLDGGEPTDGQHLYDRDGEDFRLLSVWGPIAHREVHVLVYEGAVNVVEL